MRGIKLGHIRLTRIASFAYFALLILATFISATPANANQTAAGYSHTVVLKSDGTVWAWGANSYGQLGNGTNILSNVPVEVTGLSGVVSIAAGESFAVALKSDGTVWAWGNN